MAVLVLAVALSTPVAEVQPGSEATAPAAVDGGALAPESPSFGSSGLDGVSPQNPTSLQFGPDGRLYVATQTGTIYAYTVERTGANDYAVTGNETIAEISEIPNHDDDGSLNASVDGRLLTGIYVTGTADNPVIYAASTDPRIEVSNLNAPGDSLDTNSGVLSKLEWTGSEWQHTPLVRGLPRSEENHGPNGLVVNEATDTLYLAYGGNTNKGAPSDKFSYLPEYPYSAAVLEVHLDEIGDAPYDLPTLQDPDGDTDPWGGMDGADMAIHTADSPVDVYSPGYRNPYDLVMTEDGHLYTVDNGANSGWGGVPVSDGGQCTNRPSEANSTTGRDGLHLVTEGYYAGHPNPVRANPDGAGVYDRNGTLVADTTAAMPSANPVECDFQEPGSEDGSLTTFPESTNGLTEYTASNFGGAMQGDLLAADFGGTVSRIRLSADGTTVTNVSSQFTNFGAKPLDVVAQGDDDPFPGTVWAATYGSSAIIVFEPADYGGSNFSCEVTDDSTDGDGDGYTNADEIDVGTDPCSAADRPADYDNDGISNLNDPDDDDDGIDDVNDPFQIDPDDGTSTSLPVTRNFTPGEYPDTLLDLGFTGMMVDGETDYLDMYDTANLTAGGAAPVLTVDQVPEGSAARDTGPQRYAFQTGFAPPEEPFTVHATVLAPFPTSDGGVTPKEHQSQGVYLGPGDQDNYVKLVATAGDGTGGIELASEVDGTYRTVTVVEDPAVVADGVVIDLYLTVEPSTGQVTASYSVDDGPVTYAGETNVPTAWVDESRGTAMGVIATSYGPGEPFPATWGQLDARTGEAVGAPPSVRTVYDPAPGPWLPGHVAPSKAAAEPATANATADGADS